MHYTLEKWANGEWAVIRDGKTIVAIKHTKDAARHWIQAQEQQTQVQNSFDDWFEEPNRRIQ